MGFEDLKLFNQALLARQAWHLILFPDSLCAQVLKAKYYPGGHLLDVVTAANASQTWRAIEHGLELLKKGIIWRVGDGSPLRIWRDNWIPRTIGMRPIGSTRICRLRRVEQLIDQEARSWDETALRRYFYPCDVVEILKIKLPMKRCAAFVAWNFEKSGMFTVRTAYRLFPSSWSTAVALLAPVVDLIVTGAYGRMFGLRKFRQRCVCLCLEGGEKRAAHQGKQTSPASGRPDGL